MHCCFKYFKIVSSDLLYTNICFRRRQGTEEFNLDDEDDAWQSNQQPGRGRSEPRRGEARRHHLDPNDQKRARRSVTPVLPARPDAQPAQPKPRTPTQLKSRVSLTSRAVSKIVDKRGNRGREL